MKALLRQMYLVWVLFWFGLGFLMIYPFVWLIIQRKSWHFFYFYLSKFWAILVYTLGVLPVRTEWRFRPQARQPYLFCANHYSYLDITLLTRTMRRFFVFVGLHNLEKIPLFGYMYSNIHITVDRSKSRSRYETYQRVKDALRAGKDVVIFPEGGIWSEDFPHLAPFKDGAFKIALEEQVPIVPVTIPFNWKMMPVVQMKKFRWHRSVVVFHEAIDPRQMPEATIEILKAQTYQVIEKELERFFPESESSKS